MRLSEMIYTEEEYKELENELEYVRTIKDSAEETLKEVREENKKLKEYNGELIENHKKDIDILCEENRKLKLHIEAKDKAYTALLKDYEELKEDRKKILDEIEAEIERFKDFGKSLEK